MHIDGYEHQDRAELEAQLCRANARAEAAEQRARELDYKLGLALHDSEQGIADADESEACLKAENAALREKLAASEAKLAEVTATKNGAYDERNRCVAALAWLAQKLGYRAGISAHEGPEDFGDWKHVCKIQLPVGQCSWHFTDAQAEYFVGLPHDGAPWDGHTTPEKYERLAKLRWLPTQTEKLEGASEAPKGEGEA